MTVELIEQRLQMLIEQRDKVLIDVHALGGAIQDCEFWINYLKKQQEGSQDPSSCIEDQKCG